jgi:PAS domain S-box-containing protein
MSSTTVEPMSEPDMQLSNLLHDLRTPLNQIIGLSEMLVEIAGEEGHDDLALGLGAVREGGLELASLLHDKALIATEEQSGGEYWPLADATRSGVSRVLGFVELVLAEPPTPRLESYVKDLESIRKAARNFIAAARTSGLFIRLQTARHWDHTVPVTRGDAGPSLKGGRILIVDDESLNREVLIRRLQREGCHTAGARSGQEALDLLHTQPFDVVLLDIQMPGMSGIEVLQELKQEPQLRHLPVVMLSALTDVDRVARCIELGAEDYLPKPINAVLLRARLGACLEKKQFRDQELAHVQALHTETERLSVTLRSLADAVVTTDHEGRIILCNESATVLTGVGSGEATGRPFVDIFRIVDRATGQPAPCAAIEALARNAVVESEPGLALNTPDGSERLVSTRSAPIRDTHGIILGTVVVVRDVTEKEKLAEELVRSSKLQSIGALAGGLAHDFNNMLTAVLGNLSLLRHRRNFPPEAMPAVMEAERGASRAQELTRYLLTFAEGGAPIKEAVQVESLIRETSAFVLRGSNVHCEFQIPDDLWEIQADPNQLAQVISNIVLNAVEATRNGGLIRVCAENVTAPLRSAPRLPAGDFLCISVQDYGTGIASEHLQRIFDPFFTTKKQARGLGLAAAYSIVQRHGGQIAVESARGAGTNVTFHLPAVRPIVQEPPVEEPASAEPPPAATLALDRKLRVLIMDDEEAIRLLVEAVLGSLDYEVTPTADGDAFLAAHAAARASGQPFDLAILDLTIPGGMGGKEAIARLRERDQDIRAIVSSGYSNDPVMANHTAHGFNAVLPKPYVVNDLIRVVQQVIPVPVAET